MAKEKLTCNFLIAAADPFVKSIGREQPNTNQPPPEANAVAPPLATSKREQQKHEGIEATSKHEQQKHEGIE